MFPRFAPSTGALVAGLLSLMIPAPARADGTVGSGAPSAAPEPAVADYAQARELYRRASKAFEAGQYTTARELLLEAWSLRQSYDVAASLGDTELRLGLFTEAAAHLSFSLRTFPPLENEQALASVRRQLETARAVTAALRVEVDQAGAEIRVDGRLVGTSPLADPLFVVPGKHVIEARRGDLVSAVEVTGAAATEQPVSLRLSDPASQGAPPLPASFTEGDGARRSALPLIVGGAVFAAGLTAGVAFRVSASSSDDDAAGRRAQLGTSGCVGDAGQSPDCVALRDDLDSANRARALSTTGFVVAGAALIATPLWYFLSPHRGEQGVVVSAFVTPGSGAVTAAGRF